MCVCVCAIITSSGGKEQQSTSVPSALTVAASFLHLFGTLLLHRARPYTLAALAELALLAALAVLAASSRVSELHNCTSMALLCIHFLDHISQQKKTSPNQHRTLCSHFIHFLRLIKLGQGGGRGGAYEKGLCKKFDENCLRDDQTLRFSNEYEIHFGV